jgi:hypothetical protein
MVVGNSYGIDALQELSKNKKRTSVMVRAANEVTPYYFTPEKPRQK